MASGALWRSEILIRTDAAHGAGGEVLAARARARIDGLAASVTASSRAARAPASRTRKYSLTEGPVGAPQ